MTEKVYVIPCSGIGKATASVGREATYRVVDDMVPDKADTMCLALLTKGDPEAIEDVKSSKIITIDGCAKDCTRKNVELSGGKPDINHRVQDFMKKHRDLKPGSVLNIGEGGWGLVDIMAEQIADEVDELFGGGE